MKLVKQSCEIWDQGWWLEEIYNHIAKCTRVCYQSEVKEGEESLDFLKRTIFRHDDPKKNHLGVAEHGTIYMKAPEEVARFYGFDPYSVVNYLPNSELFAVTTNMRVIIEHYREDDLMYICEPTEHHAKRITVSFITNIGISRELNRHRCHSICEESTRYCNYSKDKFDNQLTFIEPDAFKEDPFTWNDYLEYCTNCEKLYNSMIARKYKPQEVRNLLPLGLKTQVIHTAYENDWKDFLDLRLVGVSGQPHPEMKELCKLLTKELCL